MASPVMRVLPLSRRWRKSSSQWLKRRKKPFANEGSTILLKSSTKADRHFVLMLILIEELSSRHVRQAEIGWIEVGDPGQTVPVVDLNKLVPP